MKNIPLKDRPMIVVDLYSGGWLVENEPHEKYNLTKVDGRYYGYCPPWGNVDTTKLGAKRETDSVDGVIVVYTQKINKNVNANREIIAFSTNATVHPIGLDGKHLNRIIKKDGTISYSSYSIESDEHDMFIKDGSWPEFVLEASRSNNILRRQRFYKGRHPEIDVRMLDYIEGIISGKDRIKRSYQEEIQEAAPTNSEKDAQDPLCFSEGLSGEAIAKRSGIAKAALVAAHFTCAGDPSHKTFTTSRDVPYMEGHHLIPCTVSNARTYWKRFNRNIDCKANIVCLCPICHRQIHYGSDAAKTQLIRRLYKTQKSALKAGGLNISLSELLTLYKVR